MVARWIIIAVFVVIGFTLLKTNRHTRKIRIVILALLGAVLYFSLISAFSFGNYNFSSPRSVVSVVYNYFGWIGETGAKLFYIGKDTVALVGNAVKVNVSAP